MGAYAAMPSAAPARLDSVRAASPLPRGCAARNGGPKPAGRHFVKVIQINLIGTYNVVALRQPAAMMQNARTASGERGVVITTASVAAYDGQIGQAAYAASKGGIVSMTLPLARELARHGIRVMTIAPGIFDTPLLAGLPEPARQSLAQQVPLPKPLLIGAALIEFAAAGAAASSRTKMLNGEVIRLRWGRCGWRRSDESPPP